jgi:hypothetical protein
MLPASLNHKSFTGTASRARRSARSCLVGVMWTFPHRFLISCFLITEVWLIIGHWRQQRIRKTKAVLRVRSGQQRLFACDALCHHRAYGTVTFCVNSRRRNRVELTLCTIGTCFFSTSRAKRQCLGFVVFKRLYI